VELILVRHALPIRREVIDGPADPELSDDGHRQAQHLADYLRSETLHAVYSSPMKRAIQTAAPIAEVHGLVPVEIDGVAEWDRHSNEYIPVEELKATNDPRWQEMAAGGWNSDEDQGEFDTRVAESLEQIIGSHRGERVVVSCHGGVINSYLSRVLGLSGSQFFYPNYTSIHRIAASSGGHRSILSINETFHLRGTGLPIGLFQS
jgi:probable phosphoglycerate mutase